VHSVFISSFIYLLILSIFNDFLIIFSSKSLFKVSLSHERDEYCLISKKLQLYYDFMKIRSFWKFGNLKKSKSFNDHNLNFRRL